VAGVCAVAPGSIAVMTRNDMTGMARGYKVECPAVD